MSTIRRLPTARRTSSRRAERGQVLVIFAVGLVTLLGLAGLALDGGSAFAHRREQQTATDLAALAAANDYLINQNATLATARARTVAGRNGFTHGTDGTVVDVSYDLSNGINVEVEITADHQNSVVGVVGMPSWQITTTGTAVAGFPDTARGASPFIFSSDAFESDGTPLYQTPTTFGETNGDVPEGALDLAWTNYGTGNLDTDVVKDMIDGDLTMEKTLAFGEYIGQHNNGNHSPLYNDVNNLLAGEEIPVAVVDASGNFVGWATFHVISASQPGKSITGYFVSSFESSSLSISACAANDCPRYLGSYVLKLVN